MKKFNDIELIEEYKKCNRCRVVAEKFGCSDETVRRALIKYDIPRVKRNPRPTTRPRATKEELRQIVNEYYATDLTINDLTKKYHRSQHTISAAIQKYGNGHKPCLVNNTKITDEQIIEAVKTMTRQEIADFYGVHVENLARRMKKLGVHAVYAPNKGRTIYGECWHYIKGHDKLCERHKSFEYLESRKKGNIRTIRLKCKKCGTIIERAESTVRKKEIRCECCEKKRIEAEQLQIARQKMMRFFNALIEFRIPKKCVVCGKEFFSQYPNQKYCSLTCKRKSKSSGNIRKRCRKYGVKYEHGITLAKVYARDHGICQICGKPTDWHDNSWGCIGSNYPTIDHIVALANGGAHSWDNVQLAHAMCNSIKRDLNERELLNA